MFYKRNREKELTDELFRNPTSEYRGAPFWAWNSLLDEKELMRQIDIFREMGFGGFHMHVRTGLENRYLSDEFMALIRSCTEKAQQENMLSYLYDEDRWPSGSAGGLVTEKEEFRSRCLVFTPFRQAENHSETDSRAEGERSGKGKLIAVYDIVQDEEGFLTSYKRTDENSAPGGTLWYAFTEVSMPSEWFNNKTYVDTLNKNAINEFINITHEKYKETAGEFFGNVIPSVFTDEPQFIRKTLLDNSFDRQDIFIPWTDDVEEKYRERYKKDILSTLPELFFEKREGVSEARYLYHDFIAELFSSSFADTIGAWCRENNLALTGHMMEEPTLHSQTAALGEAMRSYRSFQIPGIDMLCNSHEFTTAKQAASAVHQFGREAMLSELYGVTGWETDFRTYKHQGDWQAAMGVTLRVPHLSWYAMGGEAKRDYPASISYQSSWYKKFHLIEDHFARINTAMTRGKPVIKTGVIHPVESFWLHFGPNDKTALLREGLDSSFRKLTEWLTEGSVDFDFISEALFPILTKEASYPLKVGEMEYSVIIVPGCETLRSTTLSRLEKFRAAGGRLIFLGKSPLYCDALPSDRGKRLYEISEKAELSEASVLSALADERTVHIQNADGRTEKGFTYQLRQDNNNLWLFICRTKEPENRNSDRADNIKITVRGEYSPLLYNTLNGEISEINACYRNGSTVISRRIYAYDSLLFKLVPGRTKEKEETEKDESFPSFVSEEMPYELSEENVLLLDMAEYKLKNETAFSQREEILRLDNICRKKLSLNERGGNVAQPWSREKAPPLSVLTLKFSFISEISYKGAFLAGENLLNSEITFNGEKVIPVKKGFYRDIAIDKISIPEIKEGENILTVSAPFGENTDTEAFYILGSFGVKIKGARGIITALPEKIAFGDLVYQGFPFYSGAVTYKITAENREKGLKIKAGNYSGALISVSSDGEYMGDIIYPPYILNMPEIKPGKHELCLKIYLSGYNTFGQLHCTTESSIYKGPFSWRTEGNDWSYEYIPIKAGILSSVSIK